MSNNCRGGPLWPPLRGNTMWQTWGGHGEPPLQLLLIDPDTRRKIEFTMLLPYSLAQLPL